MYVIRLDDASEYLNKDNWKTIEKILLKYNVKPIVGIIPKNEDPSLKKYNKDKDFWENAKKWEKNGWIIALHGYNHVYITKDGGINPVQRRSEFAGVDYATQSYKIIEGLKILDEHELKPKVFFAPSHTFDKNTLRALKDNSQIRIISDTIANDVYFKDGFYFLPVQSGKVRNLNFKFTTFCYHPNEMNENDFKQLEEFLQNNTKKFLDLNIEQLNKREKSVYDKILSFLYFLRRKL